MIGTESFWVAATAVATVGLLIVTAIYAWTTVQLVRTTREQSWEASRPRMLVAVRTNQGGQFLLIHVENIGTSPARSLRLHIDRPLHRNFGAKEDLRDAPFIQDGLRSFPSSTPSRFGLGSSFSYLADDADRSKHPLSFTITATYEHSGRTLSDSFPIDIENQYAWSSVERDNLDEFGKKFPDEFKRAARDVVRAIESVSRASDSEELQ